MSLLANFHDCLEQANLWDTPLQLKRKAYLNLAGSTNTNLYYLVSGSIKISFINKEGEENIVRFGYKNNFIMALDSFITDHPSDFYMQAIKNTTLQVLSKEKLERFLKENEEGKKLWDMLLLQLVLQQLEREKDILTKSPKDRYARILERSPQLFQEIPNKYIASYLRMSAETLSRLKKS